MTFCHFLRFIYMSDQISPILQTDAISKLKVHLHVQFR